jgi:hypothetical protein
MKDFSVAFRCVACKRLTFVHDASPQLSTLNHFRPHTDMTSAPSFDATSELFNERWKYTVAE